MFFLCQSILNLYRDTEGKLPINNLNIFTETDTYFRIDEDLRFLREINYIKENFPVEKVRKKYEKVYEIYKTRLPLFFEAFEKQGFLPFTLSEYYPGGINPFILLAETEINALKK